MRQIKKKLVNVFFLKLKKQTNKQKNTYIIVSGWLYIEAVTK